MLDLGLWSLHNLVSADCHGIASWERDPAVTETILVGGVASCWVAGKGAK